MRWFPPALVVVTVLLAYSNVYRCPFVFDDFPNIVDNERVRDLANYTNVREMLEPRRLVEWTFAVNHRLGGYSVGGYHAFNVVVHAFNGLLVYALACVLLPLLRSRAPGEIANGTSSEPDMSVRWTALTAALLFVAHPIQTQAVTYIVQRLASMAAMFYLASVLCYTLGRMRTGSDGRSDVRAFAWFAGCCVCAVLAFLSKEHTASLPGMLLLVEVLAFQRHTRSWKNVLPHLLLPIVLGGVFVLYFLYISGRLTPGVHVTQLLEDVSDLSRETQKVSRWRYLITQFNVIVLYLRMLVCPVGQCLDHWYPFKRSFFAGATPLAFAFLAGTGIFGLVSWRRRPVPAFGILWFFVALSIESSIIPIRDAAFEHRVYLPLFGVALLTAHGLFAVSAQRRGLRPYLVIALVTVFAALSFARNRVYRSAEIMWRDVARKSPRNARAVTNVGNTCMRRGDISGAIDHYRKAIQIDPGYALGHYNMGTVLHRRGDSAAAVAALREAIRLAPNHAGAHTNLGDALTALGQPSEAHEHYRTALELTPEAPEAHLAMGNSWTRQQQLEKAETAFRRAIELRPGFPEAHHNLGVVLELTNRLEAAAACHTEAIRLKPDYAEAYYTWGNVLGRLGKHEEALDRFQAAVRIDPSYTKARLNLAVALVQLSRIEEAQHELQRIPATAPEHATAQSYLQALTRLPAPSAVE